MRSIIFRVFSAVFCLCIFANITAAQTPTPVPTPEPKITKSPKAIVLEKGDGTNTTLNDALAPHGDEEDIFLPISEGETVVFNFDDDFCKDCQLVSSRPDVIAVIGKNKLYGIRKNISVRITIRQPNGGEVFFKGTLDGNNLLTARVVEATSDRITSETTLMSYRDVRDNYGKRIANTYVVVQLTISNQSSNNQFYVQDIAITLDPSQCGKLDEYYKRTKPFWLNLESGQIETKQDAFEKLPSALEDDVEITKKNTPNAQKRAAMQNKAQNKQDGVFYDCVDYYKEHFFVPTPVTPVDRDTILAVGKAGEIRSKRRIGFAALRFAADMGSVLTGLKLLGSDGVKAFNFLGTTVYTSADAAIPKVSSEKYENLQKALPEGALIVNIRSSKTVKLFLPLDRFFSNESWNNYRYDVKNKDDDDKAFKLKKWTELFLVSQVDGVLINDNAPRFTLKPGGGLNNVDKLKRPL